MATITTVGSTVSGTTPVTVSPSAVGNMLLVLTTSSTTPTCSAVAGGFTQIINDSTAGLYAYWGIITTTGSTTLSAGTATTVVVQEFNANGWTAWSVDGSVSTGTLITDNGNKWTDSVAGPTPTAPPEMWVGLALPPDAPPNHMIVEATSGGGTGTTTSQGALQAMWSTDVTSAVTLTGNGTPLLNGGESCSYAMCNLAVASSAPSAATLTSPVTGSAVSDTFEAGVTLKAVYNATDGANANAYSLRVKQDSGSYQYWNGTALQASQVWETCNVAPGGTLTVSIPASVLADGHTYSWSIAFQESASNLQGPFATDYTFNSVSGAAGTTIAVATSTFGSPLVTVTLAAASAIAKYVATISGGYSWSPPGVVPWLVPVAINDHPYMMNFAKSRITTMQVRRQSADDSVEPGEQTLSAAGVWPRAQDNYFLGAGQEFLDNRFAFESVYVHSGEYPSVRTRFWKSQGVNPWSEGKLSLLPEYHSIASSSAGLLIIACGTYLYKTDGTTLYFTNNPVGVSSPSWTAVTMANTHNIVSLATDGSRVWAACGVDGVFVTVAGATTSSAAATPPALNGVGGLLAYDAGAGTVNATNLPNGSVTYYVTEVDAFGNETNSTSITHTVASVPVNLTWNPDTNASAFKVRRNIGGSDLLIYDGTDPAFVDDGTVAGTTSAHPTSNATGSSAYPATFVLYAKGHLIGSTGRDLVEILANQTVSFIYQSENPGFVFTCGCECPTAILVGGYAGGTSFVGAIQPDSATNGATLAPPTWATTLTPGEQINAIAYDSGAMLLATNYGIRSGTKPDSLGTFDVNPVITDPGNVSCLAPWGQYEYFGWSNYNPTEAWASRSTLAGLGRADQSQFTTPGVPAYATDVMSTTAGSTTQVLVIAGVPYFVTLNAGSYNLWGPDGKVVASGWIEPGWIRYGTLEKKIVVEVDFQHAPLPSGASVNYSLVTEAQGSPLSIVTNSTLDSTTLTDPFPVGLQTGDRFMPVITLNAATGQASGPVFYSHITKAMVVTKRQDEILLCILFYEKSQALQDQQEFAINVLTEWNYLKGLEGDGETVNLTLAGITKVAYIDQIMLEFSDQMASDRQWFQGDLTVKLITLS